MKLHLVTVGQPKFEYARLGWNEYVTRLKHYHQVRLSHLSDKANTSEGFAAAAGSAYKIALVIDGPKLSSHELASLLEKRALEGREVCCMIGGPDGLPPKTITDADMLWSFSPLTFPHDLAMVILAESLYRASTISAGLPYHH